MSGLGARGNQCDNKIHKNETRKTKYTVLVLKDGHEGSEIERSVDISRKTILAILKRC